MINLRSLSPRFRFDPLAHGLPPREVLDARRHRPPLPAYRLKEAQAIAAAARQDGDWQPAAAYVAAAGDDWDDRWRRAEFLQAVARDEDGWADAWVDAWCQAQPEDCDAATLHASLMVHKAWRIRGSGYAHQVPYARMAQFRALLPASIEAARRAAQLAPENPGPWVVMVTAARGARYSPDDFQPLWAELTARAPHHYEAHWQALQFWCAKWAGSDSLMLRFAEQAVDCAPEGSPLAAMYLHALQELKERHGSVRLTRGRKALLARTAASLATVPADDERMPPVRHLLAYHLGRAGLHDAALDQFRLIGPYCGAEPWNGGGDPAKVFDQARARSARWARNPYPGPDGPTATRRADVRRVPDTHW
ncbi:hypothetical protein V2S66_29815 [Streptomyces sp. V4-01]|uniref:DUF4034 domain-containing protein n=1 Tax=Actinacidiphila polyblastidii TaxID=3110430 RepID=A0ABU7PJZ2_9ACTN|nr:hypothetical protein [Streptomyces sp. V4-01]